MDDNKVMKLLALTSPWNGAPIYYRHTTISTMIDAEQLLAKGCTHGTVIMADYQTEGRGRFLNRLWESAGAQNLLFTVVLRKSLISHDIHLVPLLTGLAVALAIEKQYALATQIKWPNDVLINKKKVAGILCVAKNDFILIGVGVNCNQRRFSQNVRHAASLVNFVNHHINRRDLLSMILSGLKTIFDSSDWRTEIEKRLFLNGQKCKIFFRARDKVSEETGVIVGIGKRGELKFKSDDKKTVQLILSGEVYPLSD
jgi:BirA family biotin operon repressor/biotin-[acetyl-CoA-carboxylase] ligase